MSEADKIHTGYLTDIHGLLTVASTANNSWSIVNQNIDPIFIITSEGRWMCKGIDITDDPAALREAFTHYLNFTIHGFMVLKTATEQKD